MDKEIFKTLGIKEKEADLYLTLLKTGPITVGRLAKKTGKQRVSLYGYLQQLQEIGLVTQSSKFGVTTFMSEPPEKISQIFDQNINNLKKKKVELLAILPQITSIVGKGAGKPKFFLYEGESAMKSVMRDILLYSDSELISLWPAKAMIDILGENYFENFNNERISRNIPVRAIWAETQKLDAKTHPYLGSGKQFLREIRIAPPVIDFSMGYFVYDDKSAFISSREESFGFVIESKEFAQLLKSQFEFVWKHSRSVI